MAQEQRVEAVERALSILEAFADGTRALTLTELARKTGFYPSTLLRLAASLERFGYLRREKNGTFRLGPALWRLGVAYQANFELASVVRPVLATLAEASEETAAFYIREGNRRICLYRVNGPRPIRSHLDEGAELPLDRGASAHVLMAYSGGTDARAERVRSDGVAVSHGERDAEMAAIAVPVFRSDGGFAGALGLTGPIGRFGPAAIVTMRALLQTSADDLRRALVL